MKFENEKISQFDSPNRNGVIYPKEEWEKALKKLAEKNSPVLVYCDDYADRIVSPDLTKTVGTAKNIRMTEDGNIVSDIEIISTPKGKIVQDFIEKNLFSPRFFSMGTGYVKENEDGQKMISEFEFNSIGLESKIP